MKNDIIFMGEIKMKTLTFIVILLMSISIYSVRAAEIELNMVFVPASEKGDDKDYVSLINIISKLTGYKISPIRVTDYNAAVESFRARRADIAWFGGKTYIMAAKIAYAEAFAAGVRKGDKDAYYYTYFVVRADSPFKTLNNLRGTTLALSSIGSTSGDLIPQVELQKHGLSTKRDFRRIAYAGSHDACLMSVLNKHAEACGMSSRNFDARIKDGTFKLEKVRIIHTSSPVPPPPLAYSTKLPKNVRNAIKKATLEAHNYGSIGGYGGKMERYIEVSDSDYDLLRIIDKRLKSAN
jgi:phosphonate transport system substrate-binding protein